MKNPVPTSCEKNKDVLCLNAKTDHNSYSSTQPFTVQEKENIQDVCYESQPFTPSGKKTPELFLSPRSKVCSPNTDKSTDKQSFSKLTSPQFNHNMSPSNVEKDNKVGLYLKSCSISLERLNIKSKGNSVDMATVSPKMKDQSSLGENKTDDAQNSSVIQQKIIDSTVVQNDEEERLNRLMSKSQELEEERRLLNLSTSKVLNVSLSELATKDNNTVVEDTSCKRAGAYRSCERKRKINDDSEQEAKRLKQLSGNIDSGNPIRVKQGVFRKLIGTFNLFSPKTSCVNEPMSTEVSHSTHMSDVKMEMDKLPGHISNANTNQQTMDENTGNEDQVLKESEGSNTIDEKFKILDTVLNEPTCAQKEIGNTKSDGMTENPSHNSESGVASTSKRTSSNAKPNMIASVTKKHSDGRNSGKSYALESQQNVIVIDSEKTNSDKRDSERTHVSDSLPNGDTADKTICSGSSANKVGGSKENSLIVDELLQDGQVVSSGEDHIKHGIPSSGEVTVSPDDTSTRKSLILSDGVSIPMKVSPCDVWSAANIDTNEDNFKSKYNCRYQIIFTKEP